MRGAVLSFSCVAQCCVLVAGTYVIAQPRRMNKQSESQRKTQRNSEKSLHVSLVSCSPGTDPHGSKNELQNNELLKDIRVFNR